MNASPTHHNTTAHSAKGPSQRQLRVGEMIRHALSQLLSRGDIHDDTLARHVITIPEVRMTPDLKIATAYVMPLGGSTDDIAQTVVKALAQHRKFIRREIAKAVQLKYAPDIRFKYDASFDEANRIDALLNSEKVKRDLEQSD